MFIQGNLQAVFDALYTVGAIDPVLKLDWSKLSEEMAKDREAMEDAIMSINSCAGNSQLIAKKLSYLEPRKVQFIAMEVAREFAEFSTRSELH